MNLRAYLLAKNLYFLNNNLMETTFLPPLHEKNLGIAVVPLHKRISKTVVRRKTWNKLQKKMSMKTTKLLNT